MNCLASRRANSINPYNFLKGALPATRAANPKGNPRASLNPGPFSLDKCQGGPFIFVDRIVTPGAAGRGIGGGQLACAEISVSCYSHHITFIPAFYMKWAERRVYGRLYRVATNNRCTGLLSKQPGEDYVCSDLKLRK